jgi:hypothetical protein
MGFSKDTPLFVSSPHRQSNTISTPSGASLKMIWLFKCLTVAKDRDRWGPYVPPGLKMIGEVRCLNV